MATLLDVGLLTVFTPLFSFLLVFVLTYAIFVKTSLFGDAKGIYAMISLVAGILVMAIPNLSNFVSLAAPYFAVLAIVFFLIIFLFLALGVKGDVLTEYISHDQVTLWGVFVAAVFLLIFIFSQTFGTELDEDGNEIPADAAQDDLNRDAKDIIFHPTVLGAVFILVLMAFAVKLLSMSS